MRSLRYAVLLVAMTGCGSADETDQPGHSVVLTGGTATTSTTSSSGGVGVRAGIRGTGFRFVTF
jgi:hypothetical protein